jgi:hypothetical protein
MMRVSIWLSWSKFLLAVMKKRSISQSRSNALSRRDEARFSRTEMKQRSPPAVILSDRSEAEGVEGSAVVSRVLQGRGFSRAT